MSARLRDGRQVLERDSHDSVITWSRGKKTTASQAWVRAG